MSVDNTRFNLAWLSVVLFIAVAIILGFLNMPMMACVGVFFLGLGAVLAALGALVGKPENMLIGGGAALAIVGLVLIVMNYTAIPLGLLLAAIVLVIAITGIIITIAKNRK